MHTDTFSDSTPPVSPSSHPALRWWLLLAAVVIALDQLSKWWIVERFALGGGLRITAFFDLVRAHNTGAAFSFLATAGGWQRWFFVGLGSLASGVIVWMLRRHAEQRLFCFAITMILGGAVGNIIDRMVYGHVIDFLQFHWDFLAAVFRGGYFPAFNLADSAITLGAGCLIGDEVRRARSS